MNENISIEVDQSSILAGVSESNITITSEVTNIEVIEPTYEFISVSEVGIRGPQGIQGPPGENDDKNYVHDQMVAAATWTVTHNLNKYPSVTIVTSSGDEVIGDVSYTSVNSVTLNFAASFAGKAYLN